MTKKLMLLAMAAAALIAFAVPAAASAGELTTEEGNPVAPETIVTASSANTITKGPGTVLSCAEVHMEGEVEENEGGTLKVKIVEVNTTTPCLFQGLPIAHIRASVTTLLLSPTLQIADGVFFESELTTGQNPAPVCEFEGAGEAGTGQSLEVEASEVGITIVGGANNLVGGGSPGCPEAAEITGDFVLSNPATAETLTVDP